MPHLLCNHPVELSIAHEVRAVPGGHEVVRRLLGHRSIATTIEFYAGMEIAEAVRRYDRAILSLRAGPEVAAPSPRPKRRAQP